MNRLAEVLGCAGLVEVIRPGGVHAEVGQASGCVEEDVKVDTHFLPTLLFAPGGGADESHEGRHNVSLQHCLSKVIV